MFDEANPAAALLDVAPPEDTAEGFPGPTRDKSTSDGSNAILAIELMASGLLLLLLLAGGTDPSTSGGCARRDLCATLPKLLNLDRHYISIRLHEWNEWNHFIC
jgi:hypothetical protein